MTRTRPVPRGSTLLLAMVLLAVLSVIGVAAVALGSGERSGAGVKAHRDRLVACASAAQALLWAEIERSGSGMRYLMSSAIAGEKRIGGGMRFRMGHYGDTNPTVSVRGAKRVPCSDLQPEEQYIDLTNRDTFFNTSGGCFLVYLRCVDDSGQEPRELEVELGLNTLL